MLFYGTGRNGPIRNGASGLDGMSAGVDVNGLGVLETGGDATEEFGDAVCEAARRKSAGSEQRESAGGVRNGVVAAANALVNCFDLRQLFDEKLRHGTFLGFIHPRQR